MRRTRPRPIPPVIALATLLASSLGCQQAAGPAGGTALSPVSPLAPQGSSAAPILGPFGSPARVPPPGTGSYGTGGFGTANNGFGGVAPISGTLPATPSTQPYLSAQPSPGSDVTHGSIASAASTTNPGSAWVGGIQPAAPTTASPTPRLGGMQVIDLTQAPPPPGYFPTHHYQVPQPMPGTGSMIAAAPGNPAGSAPQGPNPIQGIWGLGNPGPGGPEQDDAAYVGSPILQTSHANTAPFSGLADAGNRSGGSATSTSELRPASSPPPLHDFTTTRPSTEPIGSEQRWRFDSVGPSSDPGASPRHTVPNGQPSPGNVFGFAPTAAGETGATSPPTTQPAGAPSDLLWRKPSPRY